MRTIGLIGGMSWESSAQYYRIINSAVRDRLGGVHSAKVILQSVDFGIVEPLQRAGDWTAVEALMIKAARCLERGGADCVMICSNTIHRMADQVAAAITIPLLHIVDPVADAIGAAGHAKVGLLGTAFTMEHNFYSTLLADRLGVEVLSPAAADCAVVHRIIYDELVAGHVLDTSRAAYQEIIGRLVARGAEGVVLGCTEIMLLIGSEDCRVPIYDTTNLHALAAVNFALACE